MNKYLKLFLAVSWALLIFTIISRPFYDVDPNLERFTLYDKAIHLTLFFVLCNLLMFFIGEYAKKFWRNAVIAFAVSFVYAVFCEWFQLFVPGRSVNEFDLISGIIGILIGCFFYYLYLYKAKPKLLLHICCIGCGAYVSQVLKNNYAVTLFFYNPNIHPKKEYELRRIETEKIAKKFKLPLVKDGYSHEEWLKKIKGYEKEKERGVRCDICYFDRLEKTAKLAKKMNFSHFTSTLSVSPYKNADKISKIGQNLESKYGVKFIDQDFKKNNGFKKSVQLSKDLNLYRQNYCGCEFSKRPFDPAPFGSEPQGRRQGK